MYHYGMPSQALIIVLLLGLITFPSRLMLASSPGPLLKRKERGPGDEARLMHAEGKSTLTDVNEHNDSLVIKVLSFKEIVGEIYCYLEYVCYSCSAV